MDFSLQLIDQSNRDQTIHAEKKISLMSLKKVPAGIYYPKSTMETLEQCMKLVQS